MRLMSLARVMRRAWSTNSLRVMTVMSGAPSTTPDATEPANMPISKPSDVASREEMGSKMEAG